MHCVSRRLDRREHNHQQCRSFRRGHARLSRFCCASKQEARVKGVARDHCLLGCLLLDVGCESKEADAVF